MPTPREHRAAAAIGERIDVVGGRLPGNNALHEVCSPASNSGQRLTDMPTARGGLGAATYTTSNYYEMLGVRPVLGSVLPAGADDDTGRRSWWA